MTMLKAQSEWHRAERIGHRVRSRESGVRSQIPGERQSKAFENSNGLYGFNYLSDAMRYALCAMRISTGY
jgi:hypothetical protein